METETTTHRRHFTVPSCCSDCGTADGLGWWAHWRSKPGAARTRCRACYLAYTRRRQTPAPIERPASNRERRPSGRVWERCRRQVIEEEHTCGICGEPVDKSVRFPDPMSASVDHIVPWRDGGAWYDRANLRLAHFVCNQMHNRSERGRRTNASRARVMGRVLRATVYTWRPLVDVEGAAF